MKLSILISHLTQLKEVHGDLEVTIEEVTDWGDRVVCDEFVAAQVVHECVNDCTIKGKHVILS